MGKGKRSKDRKAEELLQNPEVKTSSKNRTGMWTKIALIAIAVILVTTLALMFVQSSGILVRIPVVYKSENFEINGAMMQYMFNTQYQNFLNTYYSYMSYMGLNTSLSLRDQALDFSKNTLLTYFIGEEYKDSGTWFNYFWAITEEQARETLALCEAAKAAGVELDDADKKEIEASIDSLYTQMDAINEEYRKEYEEHYNQPNYIHFSNMKAYLTATFGRGVGISDIRNTLELSTLSTKYYNQEVEKIRNGIESDDNLVKEYYEEHKNDYYKADYIYISFDASYTKPTDTTKVDATWTKYLNDIGKALDKMKDLNELKTVDEVKTYMIKYWFEENWQTQYDKTIKELQAKDKEDKSGKVLTKDDIPAESVIAEKKAKVLEVIIDAILNEKEEKDLKPTGDTAFDGAIDAIRNSLLSSIRTKTDALIKEEAAYDDSTDELKWVFSDKRTEGEHNYFPSIPATYKEAVAAQAETEPETEATGAETGTGTEPEGDEKEPEKDDDKEEETYVNNWDIKAEIENEEDHKFTAGFYYVIKPQYRIETLVREFGHILFKPAETASTATQAEKDKALEGAKKEAEEVLAEIKTLELTRESFETLGKEKTDDSNVYYKDVRPGDMVEGVNDWIFAEDRKEGDLEIVESIHGYHIMYLIDITEKPTYLMDAQDDLCESEIDKWFENTKKAVTIDEKEGFAMKTISIAGI